MLYRDYDVFVGPRDGEVLTLGERLLSAVLDVGHLHCGSQWLAGIGECRDVDLHPRGVGDVALEVGIGTDGNVIVGHGELIIGLSVSFCLADCPICVGTIDSPVAIGGVVIARNDGSTVGSRNIAYGVGAIYRAEEIVIIHPC